MLKRQQSFILLPKLATFDYANEASRQKFILCIIILCMEIFGIVILHIVTWYILKNS